MGKRVLQVHHRKQLSSRDAPALTKPEDLAVVCANCHLLIHYDPKRALSVKALRKKLKGQKSFF
jgi:5-methylcytosine-specific restriction protein A